MGLVGLPLVWLFVKQHRPEYYGLLPDGATAEAEAADTRQMIDRGVRYAAEVQEVEFTFRQAMRAPAFWLILVARSVQSMASPAITIHAIPFLTDIGIGPVVAAAMFAMLLVVGLPLRFIGGLLSDRIQKNHLRFILGGAYLMMAGGFALFLLNQTIPMIYAWFIVFGIGSGLDRGVMGPMQARYFGRKAFGSITGISAMIMTPVGIAAPVYFGWVYDTTGSYMNALTITTGLLVFAAVVISLARPPRPPAEVTDIRTIV